MNALLAALILTQSPTVTFESRAERLSRLLPALSKAAGLTLEAKGDVADEVLMVRFKDLPRDRVLEEIAQLTDSRWTPIEGGFQLNSEPRLKKERIQALVKRRVESFRPLIQNFRDQALKGHFGDAGARQLAEDARAHIENRPEIGNEDTYREKERLARRTPLARLVARILPEIDLMRVLSPAAYPVYVYTWPANASQVSLPRAAYKEAIETFHEEQGRWAEFSTSLPTFGYGIGKSEPLDDLRQIFFSVKATLPWSFSVEVIGKFPSGIHLEIGSFIIQQFDLIPSEPVPLTGKQSEPLNLSPTSSQIIETGEKRWKLYGTPSPRALVGALLNIEETEPLGHLASDFLASALEDDSNVAVRVPDSLAMAGVAFGRARVPTRHDAEQYLRYRVIRSEVQGIVRLEPKQPEDLGRFDRGLWHRFAREYEAVGSLSLDTSCAIAATTNRGAYELAVEYARLLNPLGMLEQDFLGHRLWGQLSSAQRSILKSGGSLHYASMGHGVKDAFKDLLFVSTAPDRMMTERLQAWRELPCSFFPNGIPPGLTLRAGFQESESLYFPPYITDAVSIATRPAPTSHIVDVLFAKERPQFDPSLLRRHPETMHLWIGKKMTITLKSEIEPGMIVQRVLEEHVPDTKRTYAVDELPEPMRVEILSKLDQKRSQYPPSSP